MRTGDVSLRSLLRAVFAPALLIAAMFALAGCGSLFSSGDSGGGEGSTFNDLIENDIADINSITTTDTASFTVLGNAMEGLYRLDENSEPIPGMAEDVEISDDETEYTFTLREGAEWSNGDPVTARDFEYAWLRAMDPETGGEYAYIMTDFIEGGAAYNAGEGSREDVGVEALDERTLEVTLSNPTPFFLNLTAFVTYLPLSQDFVEEQGGDFASGADSLLYNGPYEMTEFGQSEGFTMQKRDSYWDADNIDAQTVNGRVVKEKDTALNLYESGELDVTILNSEQVEEYEDDDAFEQRTEFATLFLYLNNEDPAMSNESLRKAVQRGFDREAFVDTVLNDGSEPAYGYVPPGMSSGGSSDETFREIVGATVPETSVEEARQLWRQGVEEVGEEPTLTILVSDEDTSRDTGTFLQSQLQENLGANVEVEVVPFDALLDREGEGDYQIAASQWIADYDDPINYLDLWTSDASQNDIRFDNARYDELVNGALTETDPERRTEMLVEAERILVEERAGISPVYHPGTSYLINPEVDDYTTPPYGTPVDYRYVEVGE
ncbi:MAG: peptide ABC transporter substrate-binding protein [Rubrobacter sp.]|nr:peptide ABC transporter substrate-binding protein [Rubrobacter sp.]